MSSLTRLRRRAPLCALVLLATAATGGCNGKDKKESDAARRDLRRFPPGVQSATLQPLARQAKGGNAVLAVTFEPGDKRLVRGVTIFPHDTGKAAFLRDDGRNGDAKAKDGVFSAVVNADFKEFASQAEAAARRDLRATPRTIFRGREAVGIEDPRAARERLKRFTQLRDADRIIRERLRIDLFDLVPAIDPATIDPARSLMITDPSVVQDPARTVDPCTGNGNPSGVWTFKHLVSEMVAGTGVDPADFVEQWLRLWDSNQPVSSGFVAAPRPAMAVKVLNPWPRTAAGKLDLDRSPFRLSAIVNRIDLAENLVYGGGSAGEGRFIFGVWDRTQPGCQLMPFSVIFEYGVKKKGCHGLRSWAQQWVALGSHPIGSPAYNQALQDITEQFAKAGADPSKPNGSALNQLRTNEIALDSPWELREFRINGKTHLLFEDTVKQTPDATLDGGTAIRDYMNLNAALIKLDRHVVPDHFPAGTPFMAATSKADNSHFQAPGIADNDARFHFSFNSCIACHLRETNTPFLHVDPQPMPATLSRFLTGSTPAINDDPDLFDVPDPVGPPTPHQFNDLDRRRQKLAALAGSSCFRLILVPPRRLFEVLPRPGPEGRLPPIRDPRLDGINDPVRMTH